MYQNGEIWIAQSNSAGAEHICIIPSMANRHGIVAGATGTGKTVTLKVLAESFADAGVPVFMADMKGDVSGTSQPGSDSPKMQELIAKYGFENFAYRGYSSCFWDIFGEKGIPLRTTVSEMGPTLLAQLLELNPTQQDILSIVFKIADDNQLLLLDMKDLREMLQYVSQNAKELSPKYGNMSAQSLGAISRSLLALENQGADFFFGEPAISITDWMQADASGKGIINILDATKLIDYPKLYATFMLWMLSEIYETMPEAGDLEKPKMIFFFDEAHLLFSDAPKALLEKIIQIVKLIRSKGIGIYFCSQSPADIPDEVLSQLGNRIQHALRAYTPADQKAVKAAAQAFRINPEFKTEDVITQLGTGEALVSFLDEKGAPCVVETAHILCPQSRMAAATDDERKSVIAASPLFSKYGTAIDRESAYEILEKRFSDEAAQQQAEEQQAAAQKQAEQQQKQAEQQQKQAEKAAQAAAKEARASAPRGSGRRRQSVVEKGVGSMVTTLGREVGRSLFRGLLDTFIKH